MCSRSDLVRAAAVVDEQQQQQQSLYYILEVDCISTQRDSEQLIQQSCVSSPRVRDLCLCTYQQQRAHACSSRIYRLG